jgi:hypothetical protein
VTAGVYYIMVIRIVIQAWIRRQNLHAEGFRLFFTREMSKQTIRNMENVTFKHSTSSYVYVLVG